MYMYMCVYIHTCIAGVSLAFQGDNVLVSSIPSVLMEREVTEVTRGRPTVAVGIVQVQVQVCWCGKIGISCLED